MLQGYIYVKQLALKYFTHKNDLNRPKKKKKKNELANVKQNKPTFLLTNVAWFYSLVWKFVIINK